MKQISQQEREDRRNSNFPAMPLGMPQAVTDQIIQSRKAHKRARTKQETGAVGFESSGAGAGVFEFAELPFDKKKKRKNRVVDKSKSGKLK